MEGVTAAITGPLSDALATRNCDDPEGAREALEHAAPGATRAHFELSATPGLGIESLADVSEDSGRYASWMRRPQRQ